MDVQTILKNLRPPSVYGASPGWKSQKAAAHFKKDRNGSWSWGCFDPDITRDSNFQTAGFKRLKDAVQYLEQVRQMHNKFEPINDLKPLTSLSYIDVKNGFILAKVNNKWQIGDYYGVEKVACKIVDEQTGQIQLFDNKQTAIEGFLDAKCEQKKFCFVH